LNLSSSPYLKQHEDNPVHWQEWGHSTLEYAKKNDKLILVSVGYATCHWCHVMAAEAFSDKKTADYLNEHFVSIKVDREQRPDLDDYFMNFINRTSGQGGWPLNVVLTPDGKPFFAGTYFPIDNSRGMKPFVEVLARVVEWHSENKGRVTDFEFDQSGRSSGEVVESEIVDQIHKHFDKQFSGFGEQTKFPAHSTMLLLMNIFQKTKDDAAKSMILKTLDVMSAQGLHDHLQGGFYRYCVDRQWQIPHFEKMLYDQAMHLWVYSTAYRLFGRARDKQVVEMIAKSLDETFTDKDGLLYSAHDADTKHVEGDTYVWTKQQLESALDKEELSQLTKKYRITDAGNFEGKNHLVQTSETLVDHKILAKAEEKLLKERKKRPQPFTDKKIVTSWNCLAAVGLLLANRYLDDSSYRARAQKIFDSITERHVSGELIAHSSLEGVVQNVEFLEDRASLLLLTTYLYEDANDKAARGKYSKLIVKFTEGLEKFRAGEGKGWYGNSTSGDFTRIAAQTFDHPIPSATSIVEMALFRADKILGKDETSVSYGDLMNTDFYNILAFYTAGNFHEVKAPKPIGYDVLPVNSVFKVDPQHQDCSDFACHRFESREDLIKSFKDN